MTSIGEDFDTQWQAHLEVIGATLFQRYRKRLMQPGITWEIHRDYPGLSLPDILIRVHAGRRILSEGQDFVALQAIRNGSWEPMAGREVASCDMRMRRDRLSRLLVTLGGMLFGAYCLVSLATSVSGGANPWVLSALGMGFGLALMVMRNRATDDTTTTRRCRRQAKSGGPGLGPKASVDRGIVPSV